MGGRAWGVSPSYDFFFSKNLIKTVIPHEVPLPHKNETPQLNPPPPTPPSPLLLKSEAPFQKLISRKITLKNWKLINTCVSVIKQLWKKMTEIPEECDFPTWSIQNFVRKEKQFAKNIILID